MLEELRRGGTNAEIAIRLGLSPETVKTHIASMLSKLALGDRRALAAWQPPEESARRRILGVLGAPSLLFPLKRPLVWAGAGLAGAAGIAAVIFIAALTANGGPPATVPPDRGATAGVASSPSDTVLPATALGPDMIVVSDGSHDALLLEWTGGPENVTRWQYRVRAWGNASPQAWSVWTTIPNSTATTTSYRLTGLRVNGNRGAYEMQVRAVVGTTAGLASNVARGVTHKTGRTPRIYPDQIVEGDGRQQWRVHELGWVVTIPDGMRVRGGKGWVSGDIGSGVTLFDHESGSSLALNDRGSEVGRDIVTPAAGGTSAQNGPQRDVGALFDQIVASVRVK